MNDSNSPGKELDQEKSSTGTLSKIIKWANEQNRARLAPVVIKQYKKGDFLNRKLTESSLFRKGYYVYSEEETKQFSGGKALALGVVFLPLALLGNKKYIKVTYHLKDQI